MFVDVGDLHREQGSNQEYCVNVKFCYVDGYYLYMQKKK